MTSEERAQMTFRSLATEAVNEIMDALDSLGNFAPLHKNEMDASDVDECFRAISDYLETTRRKFEPDKRTRFSFTSEKLKMRELRPEAEVETKRPERPKRVRGANDHRPIEVFEDGVSVGVFRRVTDVAELIGCNPSMVSRASRDGHLILGKYHLRRVDKEASDVSET